MTSALVKVATRPAEALVKAATRPAALVKARLQPNFRSTIQWIQTAQQDTVQSIQ